MERTEKKDNNLRVCIVFAVIAFLFNVVAFVSPYWIVGIEGLQSEFVRLGLWVACFDKYVHPEDYVSKKYSGCWYVYWPEYDFIRDWLNPPWFYAVQMMSSLSLLCNGIAVLVILVKILGVVKPKHHTTNILAMLLQLIAFCAYIVVIVAMGVMSKDRNWMPRPDHNRVSWSFGFAVIGAFFTLFCVFTLFIHYLVKNLAPAYKKQLKKYNQVPLIDVNRSNIGSSSGMYAGHQAGSTMYSQGGKPTSGMTSGATASAKVREAMSAKKNYGGSVASLNSLGQPRIKTTGSSHSLASMGRPVQPPPGLPSSTNQRGSLSSLHSNNRGQPRGGGFSSGDSVV